jgi:hypothetical protein
MDNQGVVNFGLLTVGHLCWGKVDDQLAAIVAPAGDCSMAMTTAHSQ